MTELDRLLLSLPNHAVRKIVGFSSYRVEAWEIMKGNHETGGLNTIAYCLSEEAACAVLRLQCLR